MSLPLCSRVRARAGTLRSIGASSLLSLIACDGPTIHAGSYLLEPDASAVSDAGDDDDDADENRSEDAGRGRDAGKNDAGEWRYPFPEERHRCMNNGQCADNRFNRICDQSIDQCVECTNNQHCEPFGLRCNEMRGVCWDGDRRP